MARILVISDSFSTMPEAVALLESSGHSISYVNDLVPWSSLAGGDRSALQQADAVIMGRVMDTDAKAFALAPNLRVVALHTSGSDNVELEEASRRGILVTNVKGVNAEQCAEFAMGLMLCVTRQILAGDRALRAGLWASQTQTSMDVHGATVGVVGLGQIGKAFVTRVRSFGTRVLVHTRSHDAALAANLGFSYTVMDDLLRHSDIVCLFASLTAETRHMIGARELGLMKPGAYIVNIARGELIDQQALLEALQNGTIAGAALDVFEVEPLLTSPFFNLQNVVLTPHQAGLTRGGKTGAAMRAARNALEVLAGGVPSDAVNPRAAAVNIR